jgi:hypothetical protein
LKEVVLASFPAIDFMTEDWAWLAGCKTPKEAKQKAGAAIARKYVRDNKIGTFEFADLVDTNESVVAIDLVDTNESVVVVAIETPTTRTLLPYPKGFFNKNGSLPDKAGAVLLWSFRKNRPSKNAIETERPDGPEMLAEMKNMKMSLHNFILEEVRLGMKSSSPESRPCSTR